MTDGEYYPWYECRNGPADRAGVEERVVEAAGRLAGNRPAGRLGRQRVEGPRPGSVR